MGIGNLGGDTFNNPFINNISVYTTGGGGGGQMKEQELSRSFPSLIP